MIIKSKPTTAGRRHASFLANETLTVDKPHKSLTRKKSKITGRNNRGVITIRHRGGAQKRKLRLIDFRRDKRDIPGRVATIEYDPNRSANIALVIYADGDKRYILSPDHLHINDTIMAGDKGEIKPGNAMPLVKIPVGMPIHNLELRAGKGGQIVRSAGAAAMVQSKEGKFATILLPSKEIRLIGLDCYATIGQVSNPEWKNVKLGKAGRNRHRGWRPSVRGLAMHPGQHPHGGGEGNSPIGMKAPKTPWGKKTRGNKTRSKRKYSNKYIIRDRRVR